MQNNSEGGGPPYLIESVDSAMRLLLLIREQREVRVTDVSEQLGVARSTAHRLLSTLAHRGFVAQDRVSRSYRAGRVLVEIGLAAVGELDVRRKARQHMEALAGELRETVNLLVLEGNGCRFVDGVESDRPIRVTSRTGTLLPAHATSGGKALLAELPDEQLEALYPSGLIRVTDKTVATLDDLREQLDDVRRAGFALNLGESEPGLHAAAVCVRDHAGRAIAALAVSIPVTRVQAGTLERMVEPLRRAALRISDDL